MHRVLRAAPTHDQSAPLAGSGILAAQARLDRLTRDLARIDAAVAVAERRSRVMRQQTLNGPPA